MPLGSSDSTPARRPMTDVLALTLAFWSYAATLFTYTFIIFLPAGLPNRSGWITSTSRWKQDSGGLCLPNRILVAMIPASIAAAASLPMLLQALLHMQSLPALVMLFVSYNATSDSVSNNFSLWFTPPNPWSSISPASNLDHKPVLSWRLYQLCVAAP